MVVLSIMHNKLFQIDLCMELPAIVDDTTVHNTYVVFGIIDPYKTNIHNIKHII